MGAGIQSLEEGLGGTKVHYGMLEIPLFAGILRGWCAVWEGPVQEVKGKCFTNTFPYANAGRGNVIFKQYLRAAPLFTLPTGQLCPSRCNPLWTSYAGPVVDSLVSDLPAHLFLNGLFHKGVETFAPGNLEEVSLFTNRSGTNFEGAIRHNPPSITPDVLTRMVPFHPARSYSSAFRKLVMANLVPSRRKGGIHS
ncbi:hypothetical protein C7212DRAFT_362638 [Tuber magnatum]|uniref:Uncharacterized protein n=1 Tax=Tuber magnatum TaxID=42249 RepID=A0A317SV32_9PEZI|nr:hypothetical protein C7212DRAFT_362638 [Tuber magnatum]